MRNIGFVTALLCLVGCAGVQTPEGAVPRQAPQLADCRQPLHLFEAFSISVKRVDLRGQKVVLTFVVTNISRAAASLMGPVGGAAVSFPAFNLVNPDGVSFGNEPSNAIVMMGSVNPGIAKEFTMGFEAPRGSYTLVIGPETGAGGVIVQQPDVFRCSFRV